MARHLAWICGLLFFLTCSVGAQQVVFSRRVYAEKGRTYQQIWIWSAPDGSLKPLTNSARDHHAPACSTDGKYVFFEAGPAPVDTTPWRFDRATGREEPAGDGISPPVGASDTSRVDRLRSRFTECDSQTWSQSADNSRAACTANGQDVVLLDLATEKEIERVRFNQHMSTGDAYPPWPLQSSWSPDGRTLLVGIYGENGSSTTTQLDYFLLDLATKIWTRAMTGTDALWLPDARAIVYVTPRDTVPLTASSKIAVWTAQLGLFDVARHTATLLTSGVTNNIQPALCSR